MNRNIKTLLNANPKVLLLLVSIEKPESDIPVHPYVNYFAAPEIGKEKDSQTKAQEDAELAKKGGAKAPAKDKKDQEKDDGATDGPTYLPIPPELEFE